MFKKVFFGIFTGLFVIGAGYWFFYFKNIKAPIGNGIMAIPVDAAFVIESKNSKNVWKQLSQTNIMWEELLATKTFSNLNIQGKYIDSILQANENISQLLNNQSVFVSAHLIDKDEYGYLYCYSLPNLTYQKEFEALIQKINFGNKPIYRAFKSEEIGSILSASKSNIYFSFVKGTLLISMYDNIIENSIKQMIAGKSLLNESSFKEIVDASGKNVDVNLYVNYKYFPLLFKSVTNQNAYQELNFLTNFAKYSGWDVTIKPNSLMLNGFTIADSSDLFLNIFKNQHPQKVEVVKVIPSKVSNMLVLGIGDFKQYFKDYKKYQKSKSNISELNEFNKKYDLNIEDEFSERFDKELALVISEEKEAKYDNYYAYIHSSNIEETIDFLDLLSFKINNINGTLSDSLSYNTHIINKIEFNNFLTLLIGDYLKNVSQNYYTAIDNYVVFGNSIDALKHVIDEFENNKTLGNDKNYKVFSENISNTSSIYFYSSLPKSLNIYSSALKALYAEDLKANEELLRKFEACAFQYTFNNKLFYSNAYLKYNPTYKKEVETIIETKLDTTLSSKPHILINHTNNAKEIFVQDDANKIYLISNTGKILWTKQLTEKIMSGVIQVDALKNNKLQLIFNTSSAIYFYDRNGDNMPGFPVELTSSATNGISIFDYEKDKNYRLFIATSDKKINCYSLNGKIVKGFNFEKTTDLVVLPVQFIEIDKKDHLFAVDIKGKVYVINRRGETKVKLKEKLPFGIQEFYIEPGKNYSKSYLIASDTIGNVCKIGLNDKKEIIKLDDFEASPYFILSDINNDKMKEYIYFTRSELKVFSQDKTLLFKHKFDSESNFSPICIKLKDGTTKLGVFLNTSNEIYLINNDGKLYNETSLKGKTPFCVTDLNNEGIYNLITGGDDNSIYVYRLGE